MPEVAQVFQEVAGAETIHGLNHLRVAGGVESTVENLCTVTTGEAKEFSTMYPRMIAEARDEGRGDVAETFALALSREAHHLEMFSNALAALETKLNPTVNASRPGLDAMSTGPQQETRAVFEPGLDTLVNAARELDRERWRVASLGRLREVVCGAQDGILSTVALVTSVAVALESQVAVLVAGLAAAAAGTISMATGAFLGSRAELDVQRGRDCKGGPGTGGEPRRGVCRAGGGLPAGGQELRGSPGDGRRDCSGQGPVAPTMAEKELGISFEETTSPVKDALVMGLSFIKPPLCPSSPTCS